jgi:hypothetical protein
MTVIIGYIISQKLTGHQMQQQIQGAKIFHVRGNLLELLMCNQPEKIENVGPTGNSDRTCIKFNIFISSGNNNSAQTVPN